MRTASSAVFYSFRIYKVLGSDTFKLDVREDEKAYTITADLQGVGKEEINLAMDEGKLRIQVTRDENSEDKAGNYIHKERRFCSMERNIYLADADETAVKAELKDGVLSIEVPRKDKKSTAIQIDVKWLAGRTKQIIRGPHLAQRCGSFMYLSIYTHITFTAAGCSATVDVDNTKPFFA